MDNESALFPHVRHAIDFETLLLRARSALRAYSGSIWSDMDEHDPGITLFEALCYNASDLAYRTSLPITDLLTPPPPLQALGGGIFPTAFGPQQALTCSPISEDDYRKAILDLHSTGTDDGDFYFVNACLMREPEDVRYHYWYNHDLREYSFVEPGPTDGSTELTLQGNYHLFVQPSRVTQPDNSAAKAALEAFLLRHRNLCEAVSRIIWVEPDDIIVKAVIELQDNLDTTTSTASILADIYTVIENYVTAPVQRYSTQELQAQGLSNEAIYEGPELRHGWIPKLPLPTDFTRPITINLARLVNDLLGVEGVKRIRSFAVEDEVDGEPWIWRSRAGTYPRLWGERPLDMLANGAVIQLFAHGMKVTASAEEIAEQLPTQAFILNTPDIMPYGRWRDPARYYPATHQLPPCYALLQPPATPAQTQLHQFLLAFEQLLANGCEQLAMLPNLLSFERALNDVVWGMQWPFAEPSVDSDVFRDCVIALKLYLQACSHDMDKELSYVDYLLGYFGGAVAQRDFLVEPKQFMRSQQAYLARVAELTYNRSNVRVGIVSAMQRRIAARFGIGGAEIFSDTVPLDQLPFYLVEHRALMPIRPDSIFDAPQTPANIALITQGAVTYLTITLPAESLPVLRIGQLVNLFVTVNEGTLPIRALMISLVDNNPPNGQRFFLDVSSNAQLQRNIARILDPANDVVWKNCDVWLEDMYYPVVYAHDQSGLTDDQKRLTTSPQSPYPALVNVGDPIVLEASAPTFSRRALAVTQPPLRGEIVAMDIIANTYVVQRTDGGAFPPDDRLASYYWYREGVEAASDRFSFAVSAVLPRDTLNQATTDPYSTNDWVASTILEELPSNTALLVHWLPHDQFRNFSVNYAHWQNGAGALGDASYNLLRTLTLGCLPSSLTGIGAMAIATEAQKSQVVGDNGDEWHRDVITENNLFFVPMETTAD
ncbi:hypothetical protein [Pseudoxanthomonas sp. UTMC 1351]|uniref:hypothetical protein n=1 Tax=Pseudoxanthomonas sp. UTMC 1351 TaxID=2695853 RepID=UPI0034CF31DA